jgi:L-ascorbate metabolism protein UlaG (beta-lactamase superfamily)
VWKNPATGKDEAHPGGEPVGFIIELENGFRIYHMGDTGLFADMAFIASYYKPDLVLMPIGGHFTMGPEDAAYATREWLKPRFVIPMHYGANPLGKGTPEQYMRARPGRHARAGAQARRERVVLTGVPMEDGAPGKAGSPFAKFSMIR